MHTPGDDAEPDQGSSSCQGPALPSRQDNELQRDSLDCRHATRIATCAGAQPTAEGGAEWGI